MLPFSVFDAGGFVLGLLLGSFLNVCIARVPYGESVVTPGSRCPVCEHPIRWFDNIPILSWLVLRGRCRDCGARISWRYPAVELSAGLWLVLAQRQCELLLVDRVTRMSGPTTADYLAVFGFAGLGLLLLPLIVIDWRTHRLPDAFTFTGIAAGLFLVCTHAIFLEPGEDQIIFAFKHLRLASPGSFAARGNVFLTGPEALIFGRIAAICGAALLLLVVRWSYRALRHRDGLGLGDVKLLAMMAALLGFEQAVLVLFVGTMLATLYAGYLLARRRANALTRLPFGSFLGLAGLFAALWGERILDWYRSLFV